MVYTHSPLNVSLVVWFANIMLIVLWLDSTVFFFCCLVSDTYMKLTYCRYNPVNRCSIDLHCLVMQFARALDCVKIHANCLLCCKADAEKIVDFLSSCVIPSHRARMWTTHFGWIGPTSTGIKPRTYLHAVPLSRRYDEICPWFQLAVPKRPGC